MAPERHLEGLYVRDFILKCPEAPSCWREEDRTGPRESLESERYRKDIGRMQKIYNFGIFAEKHGSEIIFSFK